MRRSTPWKIADLIDFEYLLAGETGTEGGREYFAKHIQPKLGAGMEPDRRSVFKAWIEVRRAGAKSSPGQRCAAAGKALASLGWLVGLILGGSVTAALLHYKGAEPVNVSWFLACTVGVQMLVLAVTMVFWAGLRTAHFFEDFHPLRGILVAFGWALSGGLRKLPGKEREQLRAALAVIGRKQDIYGSLATWPVLIVTQLFAVGYNVGILAVLLAHVAATDLAFGWQSTLQLSAEAVFKLVSALAAPWAWFAPNAHPTQSEIIASRFSYSGGIVLLERGAMASWWPFLCYAVACYGLLLRGVLLTIAALKLRGALGAQPFDHEGCNALFRRLTGPVVLAQEGTPTLKIPCGGAPAQAPAPRGGRCLALVATDIKLPAQQPAEYLGETFDWRVAQTLSVQIDHPSGNAEALAALSGAEFASVVVVVRARRAPIKAIALFLQKIAETAGSKTEVVLLLAGRSNGDGFGRVEDAEFTHWRNFQAIHGLRLTLEKWSAA